MKLRWQPRAAAMASEWQDPYLIPGTDTLANKLGIRDAATLRQVEYDLTAQRLELLGERPIQGRFDLDHLQRIHGYVFQDLYEWAGQLRTVDIEKGGARFAHAGFIEAAAAGMAKELEGERFLRGLDKEQFVERLAYHYGELNALHPFREGNGRATREFIGQLAEQAGFTLDQTKIDNAKGQWNEAARMSFIGDLEPIKEFFNESVRYSRAVAFEKLPEAEAVAKYPELRGAFAALREAEAGVGRGADGRSGVEGMAEAKADIVRRLDAGQTVSPSAPSSEVAKAAGGRQADMER